MNPQHGCQAPEQSTPRPPNPIELYPELPVDENVQKTSPSPPPSSWLISSSDPTTMSKLTRCLEEVEKALAEINETYQAERTIIIQSLLPKPTGTTSVKEKIMTWHTMQEIEAAFPGKTAGKVSRRR